jgi:hypothetical protein
MTEVVDQESCNPGNGMISDRPVVTVQSQEFALLVRG